MALALRGTRGPLLVCADRGLFPALPPPGPRRGRSGSSQEASARQSAGLYELLGVPRNATQAQIKAAYYKQSFVYHPDRNAGSEQAAERFTRIHEAYLVLSSVTLRKRYDRGLLSREELRAASGSSGQASAAPPKPSEAPRRSQAFTAGRMPQKPIFDFDKFYKAHYGEQLERERLLRERLRQRKGQMESFTKEEQETYQPYIVVCLIATGVLLLYSME